jgi:hypothetical protein
MNTKRQQNMTLAAVLALAVAWGGVVRGEPRMPGGFEAGWTQGRNNTWRESGVLGEVYESALRTVGTCLEGQGYVLRYDIPMAGGGRVLQQWEKDGERIIVMLWETKDGRTGLSWGVSE